jgi:N-acetylneuraminate synthase
MKMTYPFIIAEMSGNHNQSLERALKIIDAAADAGASAIKIQTYTADTLTIKGVFKITEKSSLWYGKDLHDLYDEAHTPWDWHKAIFEHAHKKGIICFSSPFDETAVDLLESLNNPIYKIASFEINHIPLLKYIAKTGKPVIMSTGASSLSEIAEAVNVLKREGCENLTLLKCTSTYPASAENSNLNTIPHLKELFNCEVGLSDHTMGIGVAVAAIAKGANVIEKHFCLDRSEGGVDSAFSLEPAEFKQLVIEAKNAYLALGKINYGITNDEKKVDAGKRSIYVSDKINEGEIITTKNIKVIRPGYGLHPRYYTDVLGKKANKNLEIGQPLSFNDLNK